MDNFHAAVTECYFAQQVMLLLFPSLMIFTQVPPVWQSGRHVPAAGWPGAVCPLGAARGLERQRSGGQIPRLPWRGEDTALRGVPGVFRKEETQPLSPLLPHGAQTRRPQEPPNMC